MNQNSTNSPRFHFPVCGRLLLFFALLPVASVFGAANPALTTHYRGNANKIIARTPWAELSEQDFFLFRMVHNDVPAHLLYLYLTEKDSVKKQKFRVKIDKSIREWALTTFLARMANPGILQTPEMQLRLRNALYPVYEQIWLDRKVAPQILIGRSDLEKYYAENLDTFVSEPTARVRYIFLPAGSDEATTESRAQEKEESRERLDRIFSSILTDRLSFEEAARRYSQAPNQDLGGMTPEFTPGTWFEKFEEHAFALEPGQYSPIFEGPDGVYLLQALESSPRMILSFEEARDEVRNILFFEQLALRRTQELKNLFIEGKATNNLQVLENLKDDEPIFQLDDFSFSRNTALELFPFLLEGRFEMEEASLRAWSYQVFIYEHIAQEVEDQGWDADKRFFPARQLARTVLLAENQFQRLTDPFLALSRQDTQTHLLDPSQNLKPLLQPKISFVRLEIQDYEVMGPANRALRTEQVEKALDQAKTLYLEQPLAETAEIYGPQSTAPISYLPQDLTWQSLLDGLYGAPVKLEGWNQDQGWTACPEELKDELVEIYRNRKDLTLKEHLYWTLEKDGGLFLLVFLVKPDWSAPACLNQGYFSTLQEVAEEWRETLTKDMQDMLLEGRLEILVP